VPFGTHRCCGRRERYRSFRIRQVSSVAAIRLRGPQSGFAYGQGASAGIAKGYAATKKGKRDYADRYLSPRHRDNPGNGCTMAALGPEVARSTPELKEAFEKGFERISPRAALTEKKRSFRQPHWSALLCRLAPFTIRASSNEILKVLKKKSADSTAPFNMFERHPPWPPPGGYPPLLCE
jgi:hypothetical protein